MKRTYKALLLSIFMIFGIYSCSLSTNTSDTKIKASKPENSKGLVGKAVFPASRKQESNFRIKNHGFKTKATATDIGSVSTISVITLGQNTSIATGLTDVLGNFQLDMSKLTLTANAIYILEASKRTGENVETIRTYIKWNGTSWESITTGDVIINENTTAISIIASYLSVSSIDLISKIDPANLTDIYDSTNANVLISKDDITNVAKLVTSVLLGERDPIALIKYDATKPYKYYVDQVYNYNNIATKNGCTGCSFIGADLSNSGASLSGKDLSYSDLSGQDLSKQDLSGTILIGADLSGATLPKDLSYLNLSDTNLTGQNLTQMDVKGTNFSRANLTGAILSDETTLKDLTQARFTGANFTNASLVGANLSKVYLFETIMDNTNIKKANFEKADLTGVNLSNVQGKDFTDVSFKDTTLIGSSFSGLDLTNIDLSTANVQGSDFSKTIIKNKRINTNLQNCNFSEANIGDSNDLYNPYTFDNTNLSGSNFEKATITARFNNVECKSCNFSAINFKGVSFISSNLESSIFSNFQIEEQFTFYVKDSNLSKVTFKDIKQNFNVYYKVYIKNSDLTYSVFDNVIFPNSYLYSSKANFLQIKNSEIGTIKFNKADFLDIDNSKLGYVLIRNAYSDYTLFGRMTGYTNFMNRLDTFLTNSTYNLSKGVKISNSYIDTIDANVIDSNFSNLKSDRINSFYESYSPMRDNVVIISGYFKNTNFLNCKVGNTGRFFYYYNQIPSNFLNWAYFVNVTSSNSSFFTSHIETNSYLPLNMDAHLEHSELLRIKYAKPSYCTFTIEEASDSSAGYDYVEHSCESNPDEILFYK